MKTFPKAPAGGQTQNSCTLGPALFQALAKTLKAMSLLDVSVIDVAGSMVSAGFAQGGAWADMSGLAIETMPMSFHADKKGLRQLNRLISSESVRMSLDAVDDKYMANGGSFSLLIGLHAHASAPYRPIQALKPVGVPVSEFKTSSLRQHIGKARGCTLLLYHDQLSLITPDGGTPYNLFSGTDYAFDGQEPSARIRVSRVLRALQFNPDDMTITVGRSGSDYVVETRSKVTHRVYLHVQEQAETI